MRRDTEVMKREVRIQWVVGDYVQLRREGDEYVGLCPFHEERSPSFKVYTDDAGKEWFKCFGCAEHGDAVTFLMTINKCNIKTAIDILEEYYKRKINGWEAYQ